MNNIKILRGEGGATSSISVVCPFFNEQEIIEKATLSMLSRLRASFADRFELILVDDGSSDSSLTLLLSLLRDDNASNVHVLSFPFNQGRGRALKAGIDKARGAVIVTTEVDGSWGEDIVERLVAELNDNPSLDFVVASPHRAGGSLVNVSANRIFLSRMGNLLIRRFFESEVTMNTGMTRAYRSNVIQPLIVHENGKEFHLEVLLKLLTLGFRVGEIPAVLTWQTHKLARDPGKKRNSSTKIAKTINSHLKFLFIAQPVKYFAVITLASTLAGLAFVALAIYNLVTGEAPAAFYALTGLSLLLFALVLVGFAVVLFQLRESMREAWMQGYPRPLPPSARPAREMTFSTTEERR